MTLGDILGVADQVIRAASSVTAAVLPAAATLVGAAAGWHLMPRAATMAAMAKSTVVWNPGRRQIDRVGGGRDPVVYLYREGTGPRVKIGFTTRAVSDRREEWAAGFAATPVLEALIPGGKETEGLLHRALATHRIGGNGKEIFHLPADGVAYEGFDRTSQEPTGARIIEWRDLVEAAVK